MAPCNNNPLFAGPITRQKVLLLYLFSWWGTYWFISAFQSKVYSLHGNAGGGYYVQMHDEPTFFYILTVIWLLVVLFFHGLAIHKTVVYLKAKKRDES